jgi:hypothetical protein
LSEGESDSTKEEEFNPIIKIGGSKSKLAKLFDESGKDYFYIPENKEDNDNA